MVVALAVDGVIALVTAGGDDGLIPHFQGVHNLGGGLGIGVLDADQPGGLPLLGRFARRAYVSAGADDERLKARIRELLLHKLAGVALGDGAHVEPEQGVFYVHGAGLFVDNHLVEIGVAAGLLQPVVRRELGKLRIRQAGLPVIVPDAQDRAHGDVDPAAGFRIQTLGLLEQADDLASDLDGLYARLVVDGLDIVDALVIVVNIEHFVQFYEPAVGQPHIFVELGGVLRVAVDGHERIERIKKRAGITLFPEAAAPATCKKNHKH